MGWRAHTLVGLASVSVLMPMSLGQSVQATQSQRAAVTPNPSAQIENGVCLVAGNRPDIPGNSPLVVAPHPTGVRIVWLPGFNDVACKTETTHSGARTASALARDIDHAPSISAHAVFNCPNDDGGSARMFFTYKANRTAHRIDVDLSGCRFITAPGKLRRSSTSTMSKELAILAPCGWRPYFAGSTGPCAGTADPMAR